MFPLAHGEGRTKRDQETRRDKLEFRYSILRLCMGYRKHALGFDSIKVKFLFNKLVCNVYVVTKLR